VKGRSALDPVFARPAGCCRRRRGCSRAALCGDPWGRGHAANPPRVSPSARPPQGLPEFRDVASAAHGEVRLAAALAAELHAELVHDPPRLVAGLDGPGEEKATTVALSPNAAPRRTTPLAELRQHLRAERPQGFRGSAATTAETNLRPSLGRRPCRELIGQAAEPSFARRSLQQLASSVIGILARRVDATARPAERRAPSFWATSRRVEGVSARRSSALARNGLDSPRSRGDRALVDDLDEFRSRPCSRRACRRRARGCSRRCRRRGRPCRISRRRRRACPRASCRSRPRRPRPALSSTRWFTSSSISRSCACVTASKWEKSKRSRSGR
jgi:hypothetical protein